jgi:hypothetical protein
MRILECEAVNRGAAMADQQESGPAKGRRVQLWRLIPEALLVLSLLVWLVLGILPISANRQKWAVKAIERNRGQVGYYCERIFQPDGTLSYQFGKEPPGTTWFHRLVGKHHFMTAAWIRVGSNEDNCLARLVALPDIEFATFDGASDRALEHAKHLSKIQYLSLRGYTLPAGGDSPFWVLERMPRLETLILEGAEFGDRDAKHLQHAAKLRQVFLNNTPLGDEGLAYLQNLNNLELLVLEFSKVTDRGIASLSKLPKLKYLWLTGTDVSDSSLEALSKITTLRELGLRQTKVQEIGRLRRALPNCRIGH